MACCSSSPSPSSPKGDLFIRNKFSSFSRRTKLVLVSSIGDRGVSYNPLVFEAAKLLGPPARFEASKLKVVVMGEEIEKGIGIVSRIYTLSHSDITANLTLSITNSINLDQLKGWYNKDDVIAEWKKVKDDMCLHVHCHVSGPNLLLDLVAEFRYHIFTKELPLVLKSVIYGDSIVFEEHPELMEASVWVYFHSSTKKYNCVECWGPLKNAAQVTQGDQAHRGLSTWVDHIVEKWGGPKAIFQALVAFLL